MFFHCLQGEGNPIVELFMYSGEYLMSSAFIRQIYQDTLCGTEVGSEETQEYLLLCRWALRLLPSMVTLVWYLIPELKLHCLNDSPLKHDGRN